MLSLVSSGACNSTRRTQPRPQSPTGSHPGARAQLIVRLEVLIRGEVALALDQAEAARVRVLDKGHDPREAGLVSGRHSHSPDPALIMSPSES